MSPRDDLCARVRDALPAGRTVREVAMFGGRAFMVDEAMVVSVGRDGDLLVRIDPERHEELLTRPGAHPAVMGASEQPMGPGWLRIDADGVARDADLHGWIEIALDHRDGAA
ncbi:TfoX/Sxy family protein [Propioniciclava soli]|uniref:TfoX/Sxy family protein n=1 Tax=Propioniciclava soli TaxID=2775081 RepID=A0ABZ3C7L6_9ACTN